MLEFTRNLAQESYEVVSYGCNYKTQFCHYKGIARILKTRAIHIQIANLTKVSICKDKENYVFTKHVSTYDERVAAILGY